MEKEVIIQYMSRKTKTVLIAIMLLLCVAAGAWILVFEKQTRSVEADSAEINPAKDILAPCETIVSAPLKPLGDWITAERVYSHRGSAGSNEHSFDAYDAAIEAGSHNIEQDIVISKDGTLYVSHDLSAAGMTGTDRLYSDMTDAEIDSLTTKAGDKVLKLSEVFEKHGDSVHYLVELKSGDSATIDAFIKEVNEHKLEQSVIVQSLELDVLDKLEETYPYKGGIDDGLIDSEYYSKQTDGPAVIKRKQVSNTADNKSGEKEAA